jgi:hypothetical protein
MHPEITIPLVLVGVVLLLAGLRWILLDGEESPRQAARRIDAEDAAARARFAAARDQIDPMPADEPDDSLRETNPALLWMLRNGEREEARIKAEAEQREAAASGLPGYPPPPDIALEDDDVEQIPVSDPPAARHAVPHRFSPLQAIRLWLATHSVPTGWDDEQGRGELHEMAEEHRERERERADVAAQRIAKADKERRIAEADYARREAFGLNTVTYDDPEPIEPQDEPAEDESEPVEPDCEADPVADERTEDDVEQDQGEEQAPEAPAACDGMCVTPADIGLPGYDGVAYPHPGCPLHAPGKVCECGQPDRCSSPTHGQPADVEPEPAPEVQEPPAFWYQTASHRQYYPEEPAGPDPHTGLTGQISRLSDEVLAEMDRTAVSA